MGVDPEFIPAHRYQVGMDLHDCDGLFANSDGHAVVVCFVSCKPEPEGFRHCPALSPFWTYFTSDIQKRQGEKLRNSKIYRAMELAKYETWEGSGKNTRPLFSEEGGFQNAIKCLFKSKWDFLNKELAKYATWEEFRSGKNIRPIITSEPEFRSIKGKWDFLNKELAKYATWEETASNKSIRSLINDQQAFRKVKDETYGISIFIEREKTTSRNV